MIFKLRGYLPSQVDAMTFQDYGLVKSAVDDHVVELRSR